MRRERAICLLLALGTLAVYSRVAHNGFSSFDDTDYITRNPHVLSGLSFAGLKWAFTTGHAANWHPLTWLSLMFDCQLFGLRPGLHHLENALWHTANALLLFSFLRRSTGALWRSATVAALFAWHPMHVESVAWAAERKDVLSTFFGLLALLAYLAYVKRPSVPRYSLMTVLFLFSLLSKAMLVTFPFILLLLDYWPLRRIAGQPWQINYAGVGSGNGAPAVSLRKLLLEKAPLFVLSAAVSVITFFVQAKGGAVVGMETFPLLTRVTLGAMSYRAYLVKTIWPVHLALFYPCPPYLRLMDGVAAAVVVLAITAAAILLRRNRPYVFTGWFWYLGTLVPVIGLVQVGGQMMADRYMYIPMTGILIMLVWAAADVLGRLRAGKMIGTAAAAAVLAACLCTTWIQLGYWKDSVTLFERTVSITLPSSLTQYDLAHALSMRGDFSNAIPHYLEAIRLNPKYAEAYGNLGTCYNLQGKLAEAITNYEISLSLNPQFEQTHFGLATVLAKLGRLEEARAHFLEALRLKPDFVEARIKLANLLMTEDKLDEAIAHYRAALRFDPNDFEAHYYFAGTLARQGKFDAAVAQYHAAIKLTTTNASALNDLAWILATRDDPKIHDAAQAVQLATHACELTKFQNPGYLDTLAAAYSEAGRFPEAVETTEEAVALARKAGQEPLSQKIKAAWLIIAGTFHTAPWPECRNSAGNRPVFSLPISQKGTLTRQTAGHTLTHQSEQMK
jgi:tetratricopeptide (TPR) repeat protein